MCNITGQRSTGAGLYILGLLVAGVMFLVIGSEYNKNPTDYEHLETYFWVYAIAMLIGSCGLILDNGNRFCGEDEFKGVDYFGGLFQVVSGFAWAGFGIGIAHYYSKDVLATMTPAASADERGSLAYMSGVAAIFHGLGSIFALKKLICCEGFDCDMASIFNIVNIVLDLCLIIFWFLFADKLEEKPLLSSGDNDRRTYAYLLGVVYVLMGLMGGLLLVDVFCGGGGQPVNPEPGYDDGYKNDGYGKQDGYGKNDGYGNEPTPGGYGQPQPKY